MKLRTWLALLPVVVACAWLGGLSSAGEDEAPKDKAGEEQDDEASAMAEMGKRTDALIKGLSAFVGDARLTEEGIQSLLKHGKSFNELGKGKEDTPDPVEKQIEEGYRTKGVYDFGLILGAKPIQEWAAARSLDAKSWLRSSMRAQSLFMRQSLIEGAEAAKKEVAEQLSQLEAARKEMGEEAYQATRQALEQAVKMAEDAAKRAKESIPAATDIEAALIAKHGKALRTAVGADDDEEEDEADEGPEEKEGGER